MATYVDPINGGCACAREKCDYTCETYVNRTIPGKTTNYTNYTVTRDEIAVTPNGEVAIARRDVQTGTVTTIPLIVVDGKVYAAVTKEEV